MKKTLLALALAFGTFSAFAQQDVYFRILHQWGGSAFIPSTGASLPDGTTASLDRVQYYVSGISLAHDGGQTINLDTTYLLVDANLNTEVFLGNLNITQLESISFAIGVDSATNHLDPAQYPSTHPLALHSPSMHWGWAGGYRFAALEGVVNNAGKDPIELHALGDANYFTQTIVTSGTQVGGNLIIQLDAEYTRAFTTLSMSSGLIEHSEAGPARQMLVNFSDTVFTASQQNVSGIGLEEESASAYTLQPNPAVGNRTTLQFAVPTTADIHVFDLTGRMVQQHSLRNAVSTDLYLQPSGVYMIEVVQNGHRSVQRLIVQ